MTEKRRLVVENLAYSTEWGGKQWTRLVMQAFEHGIGFDLTGRRVLEIGPRYGRMSALFARLGANVTGVEVHDDLVPIAQAEARRWGVADRVSIQCYNGDLATLGQASYDLIFAKSVLVLVDDFPGMLPKIRDRLRPGGTFICVENGYGNALFHALRRFRHRRWCYQRASYFTDRHVALIGQYFELSLVERSWWPPIYLVCGTKGSGRD